MSLTPTTTGELIGRLQGMIGHVAKRDRKTVSEAVEAIKELATRLHDSQMAHARTRTDLDYAKKAMTQRVQVDNRVHFAYPDRDAAVKESDGQEEARAQGEGLDPIRD